MSGVLAGSGPVSGSVPRLFAGVSSALHRERLGPRGYQAGTNFPNELCPSTGPASSLASPTWSSQTISRGRNGEAFAFHVAQLLELSCEHEQLLADGLTEYLASFYSEIPAERSRGGGRDHSRDRKRRSGRDRRARGGPAAGARRGWWTRPASFARWRRCGSAGPGRLRTTLIVLGTDSTLWHGSRSGRGLQRRTRPPRSRTSSPTSPTRATRSASTRARRSRPPTSRTAEMVRRSLLLRDARGC